MLLPNATDQTITVSGIGVHYTDQGNGRYDVTVTEPKEDGTFDLHCLPIFTDEDKARQTYKALIDQFRPI